MSWKDWPHWLNGGLLGVLVVFLTFFLLNVFMLIRDLFFGNGPSSIFYYLGALGATTFQYGIVAFVIGSLVGWIYGKMKK